jgi:glutathione S-transferase
MAVEQVEQRAVDARAARDASAPVLWHLKVSNYNEKARWALDYKRVPHVRRAAVPGRHAKLARRVSGGTTLPVIELDGEAIGDSTQIIEALERRYPDPPLYPDDPRERWRALKLEDFFDEELGPHLRLLWLVHALPSAEVTLGGFFPDLAGAGRVTARALFPLIRRRFVSTMGIDDSSTALAWEKVHAAGQRFRAELQTSGYLVGDGFSVADLTVAALVSPAVAPEQFPYPQPQRGHRLFEPLRDVLAESGLLQWSREMYARHRGRSAEIRR